MNSFLGVGSRTCLWEYVEGRGVELFNEVCERNLEGVVAKRKSGTYSTVSGWLKSKNPEATQSDQRYELFEPFEGGYAGPMLSVLRNLRTNVQKVGGACGKYCVEYNGIIAECRPLIQVSKLKTKADHG